jgi:hypothetical protein
MAETIAGKAFQPVINLIANINYDALKCLREIIYSLQQKNIASCMLHG